VSDRVASEQFYEAVLRTLGSARTTAGEHYAEWDDFSLAAADDAKPVTRRFHNVDEFWRVGTAAGYRDDGEPGLRPQYSDDYYGAFLLDPDGNNIEVVNHNRG
jgi:catechol 2,3-dioxygenase-like lactoylglutathione lyase family enzyme